MSGLLDPEKRGAAVCPELDINPADVILGLVQPRNGKGTDVM